VVYRVRNSRMTILIFNSGKVVVSGARTEDDIKRAVEELVSELKKYDLM